MPLFVLRIFVEFCLRPVYLVMVVEHFQTCGVQVTEKEKIKMYFGGQKAESTHFY